MIQLDSFTNNNYAETILYRTDEISQHTDAWSFPSVIVTVLTCLSALVTIIGLIMVYFEIRKRRYTKERQKQLIKDLVRHLFVNSAILEILEFKSGDGMWNIYYPAPGIFSRFCFLDDDLKLDDIWIEDSEFEKFHSIKLHLRNYNITSQVAEQIFMDKETSKNEKESVIKELRKRTVDIVKGLVGLGQASELLSEDKKAWDEISDYIIKYYRNKYKDFDQINIEALDGRTVNKFTLDSQELKDTFNKLEDTFRKLIIKRMESIRVLRFRK